MNSYYVEGQVMLTIETRIDANSAKEALELLRKGAEKDFKFKICCEETINDGNERKTKQSIIEEEELEFCFALNEDDYSDNFHLGWAWLPSDLKNKKYKKH